MYKIQRKTVYEASTESSGERNNDAVIVGDLNITHSMMNRTSRQEINKEVEQ
jgi:hypothetical protein